MRLVRVSMVVIALALVATACGGDDDITAPSTTSSLAPVTTTQATTTTTVVETTTTTSAPRPQATALVAAIQLELQILGYSEDPVDGIYGPATAEALTAGLGLYDGDITGEYDEATEAAVVELQENCEHKPEPNGRFTPLTHVCLLEALKKL